MRATQFSASSSESHAVDVRILPGGQLILRENGRESSISLNDVRVADRLGNQPAVLELPHGERLEIDDAEAFYAALAEIRGSRGAHWVHVLEEKWGIVLACLAVTVTLVWIFMAWGIPAIARLVALATPVELDEAIGIESLALMDNYFFKETALPEDRRAVIETMFQDVVDAVGDEHRFQLEFRDGESLGANAFALPSGIVVLTDKLVELAQEDDEISAVLAHEVGHATNRHALRGLIQNSLAAAVVIAITGDVGSATNLAAGIPTLLVQTGYSRDFEREADEVAFVYMAEKGIDGRQLGELLQRIDQFYGREAGATSLLSTHPGTRERLERGAARAPVD